MLNKNISLYYKYFTLKIKIKNMVNICLATFLRLLIIIYLLAISNVETT